MSEAQTAERHELAVVPESKLAAAAWKQDAMQVALARMPIETRMWFDPLLFQQAERIANMIAASSVAPKHLKGDAAACMDVVSRSMASGIPPMVIAQQQVVTHPGALPTYFGTLIIAMINASPRVIGGLKHRYLPDEDAWRRVVGKFKMVQSKTKKNEHGEPAEYAVKTYRDEDEEGLAIEVWAKVRDPETGEIEERRLKVELIETRANRFSTLWAQNPKRQIYYRAARDFGRVHVPEVVAGVRSDDDHYEAMSEAARAERAKDVTPDVEPQPAEERKSALHVIAQRNAPPKEDRPSAAEAAAEVVKKAGAPHRAAAAAPQQATAPDPVSSGPEAGEPAGGASTGQQSASLFEATIDGVEFRQPEPAAIALENLIMGSKSPGLLIDEYDAVLAALPNKLANKVFDAISRRQNELAREFEAAERKRLAEDADRKPATKKSKERPPEPASEARADAEHPAAPAAEPAPGGEDDVPPWVAVSVGEPERDQEPDGGERYELKDELGKVIGTDLKAGDCLGLLQRAVDDATPENEHRMKIHNRRELQRIVENEGPSWADHARALLP